MPLIFFILAGNILNLLINSNKDISGIKIEGIEYKINQFADDTTLLLDGSRTSLQATLNTLEIFGNISGLKMNTEKTKLVWLGRMRHSKEKLDVTPQLSWGTTEFTLLGINFSVDLIKMEKLNYDNVLNILINEINNWNKRNLTPLGRITIIKTLILSKLNHLLISLPNPSPDLLKTIQQLLYKFIWKNGPDKIKRSIMESNIPNGGLKMVNIKNFILGLKCTWIRRLITNNNKPWAVLFQTNFGTIPNFMIRGTNWFKNTADKTTNMFWKDTLNAFVNLSNKCPPKNNEDILASTVWYNPCANNQNFIIKKWSKLNINYIADITSENGTILTIDLLKNNYGLNINDFEYYQVRDAAKKIIKSSQRGNHFHINRPFIPYHLKILFKSKKGSRELYNALNNINEVNFNPKWHLELNIQLNPLNWRDIYNISFNTIQDNFYKWFQFRLIHRILGTRKLLSTIKKSESDLCGLCQMESETILHLFILCDQSQHFWDSLEVLIQSKTNVNLSLGIIEKLFGSLIFDSSSGALNTILIIARHHLFTASRKTFKPSIALFLKLLERTYTEQLSLFTLQARQDKFNKTWSKYKSLIPNS